MPLIMEIKTVPHKHQRYDTLGDWVGHERIRFYSISEMGNPKYEFLVALHEMIEHAACIEAGISGDDVDRFDFMYEGDDPGNDPKAPYHKQHTFAEKIEREVCEFLGLDWNAYGRFLNEYMAKEKL